MEKGNTRVEMMFSQFQIDEDGNFDCLGNDDDGQAFQIKGKCNRDLLKSRESVSVSLWKLHGI